MTLTIDRAVLEGIQDPEARMIASALVHRGILLVEGDPRPIPSARPVTGEPGRR